MVHVKDRAISKKNGGGSLRCPRCSALGGVCLDSRPDSDAAYIRRRRGCKSCDYRWTTYEVGTGEYIRDFNKIVNMTEMFLNLPSARRQLISDLLAELGSERDTVPVLSFPQAASTRSA